MKKSLIFTLLMSLILFCSCNGCSHQEEKKDVEAITVEKLIKADTDSMIAKGKPFVWYETLILLDNYLDADTVAAIDELVNVYASVDTLKGGSYDEIVHKFQHFKDGSSAYGWIKGTWIEDFPLVDSLIKVPYDSAFAIVNKVNYEKPHSQHVCLRNPIGPLKCNPQWVFGNIHEQIWVDATTGEARKSNPAFPEDFEYAFNW